MVTEAFGYAALCDSGASALLVVRGGRALSIPDFRCREATSCGSNGEKRVRDRACFVGDFSALRLRLVGVVEGVGSPMDTCVAEERRGRPSDLHCPTRCQPERRWLIRCRPPLWLRPTGEQCTALGDCRASLSHETSHGAVLEGAFLPIRMLDPGVSHDRYPALLEYRSHSGTPGHRLRGLNLTAGASRHSHGTRTWW